MICLKNNQVMLRDLQCADIDKRIYWQTIETEWQLWDGPWHYENLSENQRIEKLDQFIEKMKLQAFQLQNAPDDQKRTGFQIFTNKGTYIGWCNSYHIDDNYNISQSGRKCAIGINIPEVEERGKGYAFHTLCIFMDYLLSHDEQDLYIQTWSGNIRMMALANKLGFEEYHRKPEICKVRGNVYDMVIFRLNMHRYTHLSMLNRK